MNEPRIALQRLLRQPEREHVDIFTLLEDVFHGLLAARAEKSPSPNGSVGIPDTGVKVPGDGIEIHNAGELSPLNSSRRGPETQANRNMQLVGSLQESTFHENMEYSALKNCIPADTEYNEKWPPVEELNQICPQRLDVENIWEALKIEGYDIEFDRNVIESVIYILEHYYASKLETFEQGSHNTKYHLQTEFNETSKVASNLLTESDQHLSGNIEQFHNSIIEVPLLDFVTNWIYTLMPKLDQWCSFLNQKKSYAGLLGILDPSLHSAGEINQANSPYIPDYKISENQVIKELVAITMNLALSLKKSQTSQNVLHVTGLLKRMQGILYDVLFSRKCLVEVSLRHLQLVEAWSYACGRQECDMLKLLQCSTECCYELEKAGMLLHAASSAFKAAEASSYLASLNTHDKDFFVATNLHYEAVGDFFTSNHSQKNIKVTSEIVTTLCKSSNLFLKDLLQDSSHKWQVKHAALFATRVMALSDIEHNTELLTRVFSHTYLFINDLCQAEFLEEIITTLLMAWDKYSSFKALDALLFIIEETTQVFNLYKNSRPSRVQPALARIMKAHAMGFYYKKNFQAAISILEKAIGIQQNLTALGNAEAAQYLLALLGDYFENHFKKNFQFMRIFIPYAFISQENSMTPEDSLNNLSHYIQFIQDLHTLDITHGILCSVAPFCETSLTTRYGVIILKMLLIISDMQRGLGAFDKANQSCKKILLIVNDGLSIPAEIYFYVLTTYCQSLLDKDECEEAYESLKQAVDVWEKDISLKWDPGSLAYWATMSTVIKTHLSLIGTDPWHINEAIKNISQSHDEYSLPSTLPVWLCSTPGFCEGSYTDTLSWLLLMQEITSYKILQHSEKLEESLFFLMVYYNHVCEDLEPYAMASIWAHRCILLSLLGKRKLQQQAVDQTVELFHLAFVTQPQKALLPLLVILQILQIISGSFVNTSIISFDIQLWKESVYKGSTACFDRIVVFLRDLPHHIEIQNNVSTAVKEDADESLDKGTYELAKVDDSSSEHSEGKVNTRNTTNEQSSVAVDLPGRSVHFTKHSIAVDSLGLGRTSHYYPIFDLDKVPNLTGCITIIKGPLCAGGFCDIYCGDFRGVHGTEKVAMKMLRIFSTEEHIVKAKRKFRKEVNLWCLLKHPHVLPFYGTCEFDEFRLFMIAPWAEGGNALEYFRCNPFADRGRLLLQTASALEYLHSGCHAPPIVHGDLKADNVLVSASGDALLCDFGLSVHVEEILSKSGSSSAGRAGGHARFMAPELLLPPEDSSQLSRATRESDVFAFASLMLQIFTERVPFGDLLEAQAIIKLAQGKVPPRPTDPVVLSRGLDDKIWDLMNDCWRFGPSERPGMEEVLMRMKLYGGISS